MTLKEAIDILEFYNMWRRGYDIEQPQPYDLGIAIDTVIKHFKDNDNTRKD